MVEINNQRKAFPFDMLAQVEELITDVRKTRNHGYDVIVGGELFTDYSDHRKSCHAKTQNSNQQAPDATSFFPVGGMPGCKQFGLKDFSPKSQDAGIAAD